MNRDVVLLFSTRSLRLFAYGLLSVVLVLYLHVAGLAQEQAGLLLTLTLVGDTVISLWITTNADRIGRRRMLVVGAVLMLFAGVLFAVTRSFWILLIAATIGVISPGGNEVGPFLAIEQSGLSERIDGEKRTRLFAWYNLAGSFSSAVGALVGGGLVQFLLSRGATWIAQRIGLLATMVATHIPSNVLLLLVPLMPNPPLAMTVLLLRFSISQMDVPTRQAYTMALVAPEERSAAAGVTGIARTLGASLSPILAGPLYASAALSAVPFLIAGGLKILYDLLVWKVFRKVTLKG